VTFAGKKRPSAAVTANDDGSAEVVLRIAGVAPGQHTVVATGPDGQRAEQQLTVRTGSGR
jgi:hypothetical protein